jgi:hypothetical protein
MAGGRFAAVPSAAVPSAAVPSAAVATVAVHGFGAVVLPQRGGVRVGPVDRGDGDGHAAL